MTVHFSPVRQPHASRHGGIFSTNHLSSETFEGQSSPLEAMDHYRMSGPTFAPHPHAGFAAVAYVFEDSPGSMRNRDSMGNDFEVGPGAIVWTHAANGVIHEERPAVNGREIHGLQLFINLSAKNKLTVPQVFRLERDDVPEWRSEDGDRVRVVVGAFGMLRSPLEPVEPFTLLDVFLQRSITYDVQPGWNAVVYVVAGEVEVTVGDEARSLRATNALTLNGSGQVRIQGSAGAQAVVLSGPAIDEPTLFYGPFIMNDRSQIQQAAERYQSGQMGHLPPA